MIKTDINLNYALIRTLVQTARPLSIGLKMTHYLASNATSILNPPEFASELLAWDASLTRPTNHAREPAG